MPEHAQRVADPCPARLCGAEPERVRRGGPPGVVRAADHLPILACLLAYPQESDAELPQPRGELVRRYGQDSRKEPAMGWHEDLETLAAQRGSVLVGYAYTLCGDVRQAEDLV
ncbi:hypothetical protein GCM10023198_20240 [Promicromonospora umidemergens]|uniref:Uncharacterized protein n=1 Tax=Promicromonospora umidemergens TaxID=629679 RepID=A0ABP8X4B1_9MICO